ncbi:MAG: UvrD-helicase domain-containing protein, partial [Dehalococcoidales bacterium]|nr:UvrD-helicase domain-containing protein [Dehalococcoidales bacterium]
MSIFEELNLKQKEAVLATEGPVLVLAGAGSGKTKTLTHRIAYLIREKKVSPWNILAVTFTNKAASEMATRVAHLLSQKSKVKSQNYNSKLKTDGINKTNEANQANEAIRLPWLGTFHSICVRILRREAGRIGYSSGFTIYDDSDQKSLVKRVMRELNIDPKDFNPSAIANFISGAKNELIDYKEYKKYVNSPFEEVASRVYVKYQNYLKDYNAMDFDDLIMNCVRLFQQEKTVLEYYQNQFKYILIDEYQDTNQAQYVWVKLLAEKYKNIMVVGDDYQSIYGWRGANFRNILNFEKNYPGAKIIKLEQNYRSTETILNAANEVIKYNRNRTDKILWTDNDGGKPITVYEALNEKDEAEFVITEIKSLSRKVDLSNFAVLYRTNAQSRSIEEALMRFNMPYRIFGGVKFYQRKEIKDIIAYLRLIANPTDRDALERAVGAPPRGIGPTTLAKITNLKSQITNKSEISNNK